MRLHYLLPLTFAACLPTGTGNPLQDASTPGQDSGPFISDAGAAFDASSPDGGPGAFDTGPGLDGGPSVDGGSASDASILDAGSDASCPDAGPPGCGTIGGPSCACLAGEPFALDAFVGGAPLLIADHVAVDGRATVLRLRPDSPSDQVVESIIVTTGGVVESITPLLTQVSDKTAAAGDGEALTVSYVPVDAPSELRVAEVVTATGALGAPEVRYAHTDPLLQLAVARTGTTSMSAFVSATSDDPADGHSVFLHRVVAGVADVAAVQHDLDVEVQAIAISAATSGWLIAYASDEAVHTLFVDASGAAVDTQRISSAEFVSQVALVLRDDGFSLAYDGATPMLEGLDGSGDAAGESVEGRFIALGSGDGAITMSLRSEETICLAAGAPLSFERFGSGLMALHEGVRVGAGDHAALALIDGSPWVVSADGDALSLTNVCVENDD